MPDNRLELRDIAKDFFGTQVLHGISFALQPGEAVGLVGENGAGKSTLMNILSGVLKPSSGSMLLDGKPFSPDGPADARGKGVALVHQELNLFENLTIAENLWLADEGRWWATKRSAKLRSEIKQVLSRVGLNRAPTERLQCLSPGERQLVEIAKALRANPKTILLDEPTTSLSDRETEQLFAVIEDLKSQGISVIYISHNLAHVKKLCERVIVLRDGEVQADDKAGELAVEEIITLMVGRSIEQIYPSRQASASAEVALEVAGLSQPGFAKGISFKLYRGEILGLSGLMGSGRSELARMLFGLEPFREGSVKVYGEELKPSPRTAIRRGMALVTESRRHDGLLLQASVMSNAIVASLQKYSMPWTGWSRDRQMLSVTRNITDRLSLRCRSLTDQPVVTLSGGNQQKVVLAKWLLTEPRIVILDEPTRGIDVAAKRDIYQQINDLAEGGAAILLISSEMEELVGMCDRILVMASGELRSEVRRDRFDRKALLRDAFGEERLT